MPQSDNARKELLPLTGDGTKRKAESLAFLDGLRGIAALLVYSQHHITEYYGSECDLTKPYGYEGRYHFGQWRFIQLFFSGGTAAVTTFFVLSGFVLSRSALQMVRDGDKIHQYLLNAVLRRPIRLWLPVILVTFPLMLAYHSPLRPLGTWLEFQPDLPTEIRLYLKETLETMNPLIQHGPFAQTFRYDPPVWTMAYELSGSVVVYAFMACGSLLSVRYRMAVLAIMVPIAFEYAHYSLVPFVLGIMIAQVDVAKLDTWIDRLPENRRLLILTGTFILSWYLLSDVGALVKADPPWFGLPHNWIPFVFWYNPSLVSNIFGACCVVYTALRLTWLQKFLDRAAYIGKISFALYLTHVPVIWFFAYRVRRMLGADLGDEKGFFDGILPIPDIGPLGFSTRYLAMQLIVLPVNIVIADRVTVWVDQTSVSASKRFASKVMQRFHLS